MNEYYNGKPVKAHKEISNILNDDLSKDLLIGSFKDLSYPNESKQLYKARVGDFFSYNRKDMFHVPFNKREFLKNERYSISGCPCLYLGGSVYVCWEELGRPDINSFNVCRFEIDENIKMLNLGKTLYDVYSSINDYDQEDEKVNLIFRYLLTWPLQCACSIFVNNNKGRNFIAEYIIPQLIMQVISESDTKGVIYFSVKGNYSKQKCNPVFLNYAFPAEYSTNELYSPNLKKILTMTPAINMGYLVNLPENGTI